MRRCEHETIQSGRERLLLKPITAPSNVSGPLRVRNSTALFGREYALYVMVRRDNHCRFGDRGGSEARTSPRHLHRCHALLSCPAKAGHPVRRGPSTLAALSRNTGSPAFAGDDTALCRSRSRFRALARPGTTGQKRPVALTSRRFPPIRPPAPCKDRDLPVAPRMAAAHRWERLRILPCLAAAN